jgi:hypothetical protein
VMWIAAAALGDAGASSANLTGNIAIVEVCASLTIGTRN